MHRNIFACKLQKFNSLSGREAFLFTIEYLCHDVESNKQLFEFDDHVRRIGVVMVSKCDCCAAGNYEELNHVFCQ